MGQWGIQTDACDSVHDFLQDVRPNCQNFDQEDADKVLENVWDKKNRGSDFDRLGVVTFLLTHELVVPIDKLQQALEIANEELHVDRLKTWQSPKERHAMIVTEMNDIRFAIENGGKGRKREIMETGDDYLIEETLAPKENTVIILGVYGIVVNLTGDGGGSITSDLHEFISDDSSDDSSDDDAEQLADYNNAMNGIESVVLGHAIAGIDITTPAYLEGIESAVQGCANSI